MKMSKQIKAFLDESKKHDGYWVEKAKLDFAMGLETQRRRADLNSAAMAKRLGTSQAYISKVFRGDTNVTIETMVKLAKSVGGKLDLNIVPAEVEPEVRWVAAKTLYSGNIKPARTATVYSFPTASDRNATITERRAQVA